MSAPSLHVPQSEVSIGIGKEAIGNDRIDTAPGADSRRRWVLLVTPLDNLSRVIAFETMTTTTFGARQDSVVIVGSEGNVIETVHL